MDEADTARRFTTLQPRSKARIRHLAANSERRASGDGKLQLEGETSYRSTRTRALPPLSLSFSLSLSLSGGIFHSTPGMLFSITLFKYHALFSNAEKVKCGGALSEHGFTLLMYRALLRRLLCSGFTLACQERRST